MIQKLVASALIAGIAVGLFAALLHFAFVQEKILLGEHYESGELTHFGGSGSKPTHDHAPAMSAPEQAETTAPAPARAAGHDHSAGQDHAASGETSAFTRNALTVIFTVVIYTSYALLLVAGFGVAESLGHRITAREGLLWGIGGFFTFQMAPAMGLAPELPGTIAAELSLRQIWWWTTVICTGSGLVLLAYARHWALFALAGALLALPHVIGAPEPEGFWGMAPTELGASFSANVLGTGLIVWALLGWVAGAAWSRPARA